MASVQVITDEQGRHLLTRCIKTAAETVSIYTSIATGDEANKLRAMKYAARDATYTEDACKE